MIAPALLLYTAVVALLRPRGVMGEAAADSAPPAGRFGRTWYPVAAFACLLAVACVLNFRVTNGRSESPAWTSVVAAARTSCQKPGVTSYLYLHAWWGVHIPCHRVDG